MSYQNEVTFMCDSCERQFIINEETMELPPGWIGIQVVIADTEGFIPDHEREVYSHVCSRECLIEYASSTDMRQRICLVEKPEYPTDNEEELS